MDNICGEILAFIIVIFVLIKIFGDGHDMDEFPPYNRDKFIDAETEMKKGEV